jgi:hypothetical protein
MDTDHINGSQSGKSSAMNAVECASISYLKQVNPALRHVPALPGYGLAAGGQTDTGAPRSVRKIWGLGFAHEKCRFVTLRVLRSGAVINDWVVPPIKARGNRISCCFLLHFPGFLDFLNLLRFNPFS